MFNIFLLIHLAIKNKPTWLKMKLVLHLQPHPNPSPKEKGRNA
jgi:hypothetical protein